jgi:hypothetical protein
MQPVLGNVIGFYLMICCQPQYALVWADGHHTYFEDQHQAAFFSTKEEAEAARKDGETVVTLVQNHR